MDRLMDTLTGFVKKLLFK